MGGGGGGEIKEMHDCITQYRIATKTKLAKQMPRQKAVMVPLQTSANIYFLSCIYKTSFPKDNILT